MRLSLCLIARDEEQFIGACLASAASVVDEIIVVDTGSRDNTVAIAEAAGATVVHRPWQNDFSAARNASLDAASGDWVLILDADEQLAPGTIPGLYISALAEAANGAWPVGLFGRYGPDDAHLRDYLERARTDEGFADYLDEFVYAPKAAE